MNLKDNSILIIDDDPWMQRVLSKIFTKMEIDKVYFANNGFDGVNFAILKRPDVIFLDLMMPEIDGILTLKMLKAIELTKKMSVIVITANSDFENLGAVISCGASEFVAKPFTYTTIMDKLESVLSKVNGNKINSQIAKIERTSGAFDYDELDPDEFEFFSKFNIDTKTNVSENRKKTEVAENTENIDTNLFVRKYKNNNFENENEIKKMLKK